MIALPRHMERHPFLWLSIIAVIIPLPLFFYLRPTLNDNDLLFYKILLQEFSGQLWHGNLYPRWLYNANDGHGSPVFLFYGPGAFYITSLLGWLSATDPQGNLRFALSMALARVVSGWLGFLWLRRHGSVSLALLATLLYLSIPYSIHEIYVRTALTEQWAMCAVFGMFYYLDTLINGKHSGIAGVALMSAAALMIHLPTFVTFCWIPFIYIYMVSVPSRRLPGIAKLMLGYGLALGLSAVYILPLLLNKHYIQANNFTSGEHNFTQNFFSINEIYCAPYFILSAIFFYYCIRKKPLAELPVSRPFLGCVFSCIAIIFLLQLPFSAPIWQALPPLQYLQFPFRFLPVAMIGFACIAALIVSHTKWAPAICIMWGVGLIIHAYIIVVFSPHDFSGTLQKISDYRLIMPAEYLTRWNQDEREFRKDQRMFRTISKNSFAHEPAAQIISGKGEVAVMPSAYDAMVIKAHIQQPAVVALKWFYFPGVQVKNLTTGTLLKPYAGSPEGLVNVDLAPGEYTLETSFSEFEGAGAGMLISLISLILVMILAMLNMLQHPRFSKLSYSN